MALRVLIKVVAEHRPRHNLQSDKRLPFWFPATHSGTMQSLAHFVTRGAKD